MGDAAAIRQGYGVMHGTCQGGMPTGVHAALSIVRVLAGKQPKPFRFGYYHTPVSLGRHDAVVQFTHPDDSPRRMCLTGRLAVRYKETVTASPWPTYGRMKKMPASGAFWPRGGRFTRADAGDPPAADLDQQVFHQHRNLLFSVAYRILGTAADAEDAVQDAWIKWSAADRSQVADPKAYLARIVSNLAMERLRSTRHQRETYVGPWLPEPILTDRRRHRGASWRSRCRWRCWWCWRR